MKRNLRYTEDRNRALKTTRKKVRFSVTPYTKVRDGETPSPARETRTLPRTYGFDPWEQRHRLADNMAVRQSAPLRVRE